VFVSRVGEAEPLRFSIELLQKSYLVITRTVARKSSIGGCTFLQGGFTFLQGGLIFKFDKIPLTYTVSYFNLGDLELCSRGLSPPKPTRGDGTGDNPVQLKICSKIFFELLPTQLAFCG